jgi:transcription initiation factor TFIIIB Brf1 subunit/transcription initiation factor TFIIB
MEFKCPKCQSIIYSRRHKVCGQCGAELPKELLLTEAQVRALDKQLAAEKKRAREFNLPDSSSGYL